MKRTIDDIYNLILQKIENARNDYHCEKSRIYPNYKKCLKLDGEIEAYEDIEILIKTSGVLNNDSNN